MTIASNFPVAPGETSRDPVVLLRQAGYAIVSLRDPSRPLPAAKYPPSEEARAAWAEGLAAKAEALRKAHDLATLGLKERDAASAKRQRALDDFNGAFTRLAGWLEATYRAAGLDSFADKVHPSGRRKGRLAAEVRRESRRQAAAKPEPSATRESEAPVLRLVHGDDLTIGALTSGDPGPASESPPDGRSGAGSVGILPAQEAFYAELPGPGPIRSRPFGSLPTSQARAPSTRRNQLDAGAPAERPDDGQW